MNVVSAFDRQQITGRVFTLHTTADPRSDPQELLAKGVKRWRGGKTSRWSHVDCASLGTWVTTLSLITEKVWQNLILLEEAAQRTTFGPTGELKQTVHPLSTLWALGRWEMGSSASAAPASAHHVAPSSRCTSPPLPGHLIKLTSPEAHSLHSATQAGEMPNKLSPDQNANGLVPSKCSVPVAHVSVDIFFFRTLKEGGTARKQASWWKDYANNIIKQTVSSRQLRVLTAAQVELIQPIQKETFPSTVLALCGDGRKAAESRHMSTRGEISLVKSHIHCLVKLQTKVTKNLENNIIMKKAKPADK
ncbi:hypothetical protein EK904_005959 [Melospiza melodia maxima]|nr:hypothetical protein EK904_005959 [Melospiza melodia maxima]